MENARKTLSLFKQPIGFNPKISDYTVNLNIFLRLRFFFTSRRFPTTKSTLPSKSSLIRYLSPKDSLNLAGFMVFELGSDCRVCGLTVSI